MEKYIGRKVVIVYQDQKKHFSQRKIKVIRVDEDTVKAFCYRSNAPRVFKKENILSFMLVDRVG